jgi:hypothetical protein
MDLSLATPELRPRCSEIQSLTSISTEVRDEGYSPSPHTGIGKDEGYSPLPVSVSLFPVIRTCLFTFNPSSDPRALLPSLHSSQALSAHTTLPFLPSSARLCGARIPPSVVRSGSLTGGQSAPIPSLTLEEAFPPTNLTGIHFWSEGCSDLEQI